MLGFVKTNKEIPMIAIDLSAKKEGNLSIVEEEEVRMISRSPNKQRLTFTKFNPE